jgi:hypothetical protein
MALVVILATAVGGTSLAAVPTPEELAPNTAMLVTEMPVGPGTTTKHELGHELLLEAVAKGRKTAPKPGGGGYRRLVHSAVNARLEAAWLQGQAAELNIAVTPRQVSRELARIRKENFKSQSEYRRFLRESRYTRRDVRERVELQLLATRLQEWILRGAKSKAEEQKALRDFVAEFSERWRARTVCAVGYVTESCSNGPLPPR